MKATIVMILSFSFCLANSQSLIGTWQITRVTNCLEEEVSDSSKTDTDMMKDFASKSNRSPKVVSFKADNSGEEKIKTLEKKRSSSVKKFHYKHDGTNIYILDKKSHLLINTLIIDTLTADSLVYHTTDKTCEKTFFVRTQ